MIWSILQLCNARPLPRSGRGRSCLRWKLAAPPLWRGNGECPASASLQARGSDCSSARSGRVSRCKERLGLEK